jgi:hypothetical protein
MSEAKVGRAARSVWLLPVCLGLVVWACGRSRADDAREPKIDASAGSSAASQEAGSGGQTTLGNEAGMGGRVVAPSDPCVFPLSELEHVSVTQALCELCRDGEGYRVANDCGGVNLVRPVQRAPVHANTVQIWSLDGSGELVGFFMGPGLHDDCSAAAVYGTFCEKLELGGYDGDDSVCDGIDDESDRSGTGGGASGESSRGTVTLAEAELCGMDCGHRDLSAYCDGERGPEGVGGAGTEELQVYPGCPSLAEDADFEMQPPTYGLWHSCAPLADGSAYYDESSCGYSLVLERSRGREVWHYDDDDQLVGGEITRTPQYLLSYCEKQTFGQQCSLQGNAMDLCSTSEGGCIEPFVAGATRAEVDLGCPQTPYVQNDNDCGGVNLSTHDPDLTRGSYHVLSYNENDQLVGWRHFSVEAGTYLVRKCDDGKVAIGTVAGSPCNSVGDDINPCE